MCCSLNPLFKTNASQRTHKEAVDRDIFTDAIEEACSLETDSTDNHFIIGSSFHSQSLGKPTVINRIDKLLDWLLNEVKSQELKNLYVTFVTGTRNNLITKEMHKNVHGGKMACHRTLLDVCNEPRPMPPHIPVNDDFELSIELIRHGRRLTQTVWLFLHQLLDPYQLHLLEKTNESFLQSFTGHLLADHIPEAKADVSEEELEYFPDSDPSLRYVSCFCLRRSFYLKSS